MNDPAGLDDRRTSPPNLAHTGGVSSFLTSTALSLSVVCMAFAAQLDPAPSGWGTHTQLGLVPCSFMAWVGLPCGFCGVTTTFAIMSDLRPVDALINQPFGFLLWWTVAFGGIIAALEMADPRDRWRRIIQKIWPWRSPIISTYFLVFSASWAFRIAYFVIFLSSES